MILRYISLPNICQFVYFVCGISSPKRRVVRRRNLARRRVPTTCRTCARGRRYVNNDIIFQKCGAVTSGRSVRPQAVGPYQPAGWLAAAARWPATVT